MSFFLSLSILSERKRDAPEGVTVTPPPPAVATSLDKGKGKRTAEEAEVEERNAREKKRVEAKAAIESRDDDEDDEEDEEEGDEEEEEDEEAEGEDESDEEVCCCLSVFFALMCGFSLLLFGFDVQVEESFEEIDPSAIRSRRTRGVKVDYTSAEALEKAGLKADEGDDDE